MWVGLVFQPNSLIANPTGETIVHGAADVDRTDPSHLTIQQHTDKAIIDWTSFSIGAAESVTFSQPSSTSLAVNRVIGNESSSILGQLTANGRLMLINPNGILFGAGSRVDVNSLIATTIDISNERILANDFTFDQMSNPAATIVNRGTITAAEGGLVALVGPGVENTGVIQARLGTVSLASGDGFTLDLFGDGLVKLPVDAQTSQQLFAPDGTPLKGLVNNSGTIQADGGTVLLTAQTVTNILDRVINMDGIVQANSVAEVNGQIVLSGGDLGVVEVAGTLKASGDDVDEKGGIIKVLGEKVGLFGDAIVNASGEAGGGEVLIGGNFQGNGPEQNAKKTYLGEDVTINAHAKAAGDGGRVIVWADEISRYYGNIDVRGGEFGGNGGFAEVSGKQNLDFQGTANLSAVHGDFGTLLLDPLNIIVITGGTAAAGDVDAFADNPGSSLTIAPATLDAVAGNVTLQATADISFINAVNLTTAGATFTAQAQDDISVNADITTNAGAITLSADDDASGAGSLTLAAGVTVNSGGANISMKAFDMTIDGTSAVNSGAGSTTLLAAVGGTDVGGTSSNLNLSTTELDRITAGVIKIGDATSGAITISSDITPANTTTLHLQSGAGITATAGGIVETNLAISAGGTVNFTDATTDVDNLAVSAPGQTVTFVDADDLDLDTVNGVIGVTAGTLNLTTGGALTDAQAITATNLSITNTAADTTLDVATNDVDNLAVSASGRTVTFRDVDDLDIDTVNSINGVTAATLNLTTGGALTDAQAVTATNLSVTAGGAVTLDTATNDVDTLAIDTSTGNVTFTDADGFSVGTVNGVTGVDTDAGAVALTATTGTLTVSNTAAANDVEASGDITLTAAANEALVDIQATADVESSGGAITVTADDINLAGTITNTGRTVTLAPETVNDADVIDLGPDPSAANRFELAASDIDNVTAGTLVIGTSASGAMTIEADITPANTTTLHLQSGGSITGTAGGIVETNLAVTAGGAVNFSDTTTDVDNLAVSAAGQTVTFVDTDDLDIDTVNGIVGATATTLNLTTGGALTDAQAITATNLSITNTAADTTLDVATTDVDNLAVSAAGRTVSFRDTDDLNIDTVNGVVGVTSTTLNLTTGGALTDAQAVTTTNLSVTAGGAVTLDTATNDVDTLAIDTSTGSVTFTDADGFSVGTVNGVTGVDTDAGAVALTATTGTLTVSNTAAANDVEASGNITLTAAANEATVDVQVGADVESLAGNISIISDIISLPGTLTASAGANQSVTLAPETANDVDVIDVGTDGTIANRFEITNTVIDQITTDTVVIGSSASGALTVSADITAANATGLDLRSGSTVTASAGGIIEDSLAVTAGGTVTFSDAQQNVTTLAINAAGQIVNYTETTGYALGLVNGISGATAGTLNLMSGGALTGALTATALQISGTSAILTGTLNGLANQAAASAVTFIGAKGAGPYTLNGFSIFGSSAAAQSSASTSAQNRAVTIPPAIIYTQVHQTLLGTASPPLLVNLGSGSSTPQDALSQELLSESLEPNIFGNRFQLVAQSEELKMAFNPELDLFVNFWSPPDDEDLWPPISFPFFGQEEQQPEDLQALQD
ncbi:filamentous hemagglutinin N-terminal domain-containing protein [Candidatus Nitronereus thalassa]|uniref:Filamentous hemagglutinin N-terminal domain-containing protein n=1 Tax=Candidatus Nitronereus thalassa TaxID=3020898 RepID=A0ABU3KC95_9BACT|nr:filamentous hemagglutinin N-terminal domain-containing protein [Candidatus Nitronereus thalassa]MDT7044140.1 filamentous hemagglutinin N-terminal domain-containing protein [Candidatus Nitronereus thalassa]